MGIIRIFYTWFAGAVRRAAMVDASRIHASPLRTEGQRDRLQGEYL